MNKLIEFNDNSDTTIYRPSLLEDLQQKHQYFEVPDIESQINRQNNPHNWLQKDILHTTNYTFSVQLPPKSYT